MITEKHSWNKWLCEIAAGVGITPALMLAARSPDSEKQLKSQFNPPPHSLYVILRDIYRAKNLTFSCML